MDAKSPAARSAANHHDESTTRIGNALGALFVAGLAALFLYGYIPQFLSG
jgi:hypothetical protein